MSDLSPLIGLNRYADNVRRLQRVTHETLTSPFEPRCILPRLSSIARADLVVGPFSACFPPWAILKGIGTNNLLSEIVARRGWQTVFIWPRT
jgi:hypothetical protein